MKYKYLLFIGLALLAISLVLVACGGSPAEPTKPAPMTEPTAIVPASNPAQAPQPTAAAGEAISQTTQAKDAMQIPNESAWAGSAHAKADAEAFNHWNEADPKEVPVDCAKCHSTPGFQDFVGADGSPAGVVDKAAPIGTVITCVACHNDAAQKLTSVKFPSGAEITNLGPEARCITCHSGRASKTSVDDGIKKAGVADDDTPSDKIAFVNIHYLAAGATQYGTQAKGGYEYEGKSYDLKFNHVPGYNTCTGCHDPHSLEVKVNDCQQCHTNVKSEADLQNIRMNGSTMDYNGNGDTKEGIAKEVAGLQDLLLQDIQAYASEVAKAPIAYDAATYPYFFADANNNGKVDKDEKGYKAFTGRLLKAAYNYQTSIKDPGAYAHNAKYMIELLYDSIADLNTKVSKPIDMTNLHREDAGHFAGSQMPWRDWDETGVVPGDCAKCHSPTGLPIYLNEASLSRDGVTGNVISQPAGNGLACSTCHNDLTKFTRITVDNVKFPSGLVVSFGKGNDANLCISCHQGRESTNSVNNAIKSSGAKDDEVSAKLSFRNPHYFAAGATMFGTEAKGAYEYADQQYNGRFMHVEKMQTCTNCHDAHSSEVRVDVCAACHTDVKTADDLVNIRMNDKGDYDGNGKEEGLGVEIANEQATLLAAIQKYATEKTQKNIVYSADAYPYWFEDANNNGKVDDGEKAFAAWTPRLLRAAYNYQWVTKDPGAFAHNGHYILQVMYDTLKDMGVDVSKMTRPEVVAPASTTP